MTLQADWAFALIDPNAPLPEGITTWNGSDAKERFSVYRNNVASSLIDTLGDSFPAVLELVGENFFRAMAKIFVQQHLPQSPVLALYGREFPEFINDFPPAASVPYLADVARLEYAYIQSYHAADAPSLNADQLTQALNQAETLSQTTLTLHPSFQSLSSPFALASLWQAHQGALDIGTVDPFIPESAWIFRNGLDTCVMRVSEHFHRFTHSVLAGCNLAQAVEDAQDEAFDVSMCLCALLEANAIVSLI